MEGWHRLPWSRVRATHWLDAAARPARLSDVRREHRGGAATSPLGLPWTTALFTLRAVAHGRSGISARASGRQIGPAGVASISLVWRAHYREAARRLGQATEVRGEDRTGAASSRRAPAHGIRVPALETPPVFFPNIGVTIAAHGPGRPGSLVLRRRLRPGHHNDDRTPAAGSALAGPVRAAVHLLLALLAFRALPVPSSPSAGPTERAALRTAVLEEVLAAVHCWSEVAAARA
jgi:hypothetical protein